MRSRDFSLRFVEQDTVSSPSQAKYYLDHIKPTVSVAEHQAIRKTTVQSPLVITGMGMISPLGYGVKAGWKRLLAGRSGLSPITRFDTSDLPVKVAGTVPDIANDLEGGFDPDRLLDAKERRKME